MSASDILSIVAIVIAGLSLLNSWWQGRRTSANAKEANDIARGALELARETSASSGMVFIQPIRWDSGSNRVFFQVTAGAPVAEVEFEFLNYAKAGGKIRQTMVHPGEHAFPHGDFVHEPGSLGVPGAAKFAATARWRRTNGDAWSTCGLYLASKTHTRFVHADP